MIELTETERQIWIAAFVQGIPALLVEDSANFHDLIKFACGAVLIFRGEGDFPPDPDLPRQMHDHVRGKSCPVAKF